MFTKILIAEDIDSISFGLIPVIENYEAEIVTVRYCDDALLRIRRALADEVPFDLLITDLSFSPDHRQATLTGGEELIIEARKIQPELPVLVYSVEDRIHIVRRLTDILKVNGYVWKGRESTLEIARALNAISDGDTFISARFRHLSNENQALEIDDSDLQIIRLLSQGLAQDEISEALKQQNKNSSKSFIEKRLNKLRDSLKAKTNPHLVTIAKDMGLI